MSKKLLRSCSSELSPYILLLAVCVPLFTVIGCAPRPVPPPVYRGFDLTLEEVTDMAGRDIEALKAVAHITIQKDGAPFSSLDASLLLKKPGWVQVKWYKMGLLAGSLLVKEKKLRESTGKGAGIIEGLGDELYYTVFWWEGVTGARMFRQSSEYVIRSDTREIRLDAWTLLPKKQTILYKGREIYVVYDRPVQEGKYWYTSELEVGISPYLFTIRVDRLTLNPQFSEDDFKTRDGKT